MPRPDPVAALLRLRRIEMRHATLRMAGGLAGVARAEAALAEAEEGIRREAAVAGHAATDLAALAAWLPRARAARTRALLAGQRAGAAADQARAAMGEAYAALRLAEEAAARHAAARRRKALAAEQRGLDDLPRPATPPRD